MKQNIETVIKEKLINNGLFSQGADMVIANMKASQNNAAMSFRWGDYPEDYPEIIMNLVWFAAKKEALKWIDQNRPQHWSRPMFL